MSIEDFQHSVRYWLTSCLGPETAENKTDRAHRFFEEAIELVQASGVTRDDCLKLVDYVYGRPAGEIRQEAGGVMLTLAALCSANKLKLGEAAKEELRRVWSKFDDIRVKDASKPKASPLPGKSPLERDQALADAAGFSEDGK